MQVEMAEVPKWITIQVNTFTNWLNHELRHTDITVNDLTVDLSNGITLIRIVECLQNRICKAKVYAQNPTEIQCLMNVQMALDALSEDGIKLVNIGSQDIVKGNLKLILGLIWALIQRYQLGSNTKLTPKKLLMSWLQAILPEIKLSNLRLNWNDGIALTGLVNYCNGNLLSNWRELNPENRLSNCENALKIAESELNVPIIISAEHLSSKNLDELSCITYLSYFVKENGPGYLATLERVRQLLPDVDILDFGPAWKDGYLLCRLIQESGARIPSFEAMTFNDSSHSLWNIRQAFDILLDLKVNLLITPEDVGHDSLGLMELCATVMSLKSRRKSNVNEDVLDTVEASCFTGQQLNMDLAFAEDSEVNMEDLDIVVVDERGQVLSNEELGLIRKGTDGGAMLSLVPKMAGVYKVRL